MSYTVCIYNGNVGTENTFDTFEEAKACADDAWYHLTPAEKRRTTDRDRGAWFYISENDEQDVEIRVAYDYGDRRYEVRWTDGTRDHSLCISDFDEAREFFHSLCMSAENRNIEMIDTETDEVVFAKEAE